MRASARACAFACALSATSRPTLTSSYISVPERCDGKSRLRAGVVGFSVLEGLRFGKGRASLQSAVVGVHGAENADHFIVADQPKLLA